MFEDIFGQMMGGAGARAKRSNRGQDLRYNLEITLEQWDSAVDSQAKAFLLAARAAAQRVARTGSLDFSAVSASATRVIPKGADQEPLWRT